MNGYTQFFKKDGTPMFLCNTCALFGFCSRDETIMIEHVKWRHGKKQDG